MAENKVLCNFEMQPEFDCKATMMQAREKFSRFAGR